MRNNLERIKRFLTDKYKILIPIVLIIVLLLSFLIYNREYKYNRYTENNEYAFYQHYMDEEYEFKAILTTDRKKLIKDIKLVDIDINMDSTPIYYKNIDKVIFPEEMLLVFPMQNGREYSLLKYSTLEYKNNNYYIFTKNYNNYLKYFFLYDCKDLYFFIDEVTLYIGEEEIYLSPMSYVKVNNDGVEYYNKKENISKYIEISDINITVKNEYLDINLKNDYIYYNNTLILLSPISTNIETIDKIIK